MKLVTITNLYPRPDEPERGMYNAQLFRAMAKQLGRGPYFVKASNLLRSFRSFEGQEGKQQAEDPVINTGQTGGQQSDPLLTNVVLVPEWRVWRWGKIRRWQVPEDRERMTDDSKGPSSTHTQYLPCFYIPLLGRSISWWFYKQALSKLEDPVGACDAVLSTWLYPDGVAATRLAFSLNIPSWIMVLGSDAFHLDNAARRRTILDACAKAEGLICVSQNLADRLIDVGVAEEKVHVVPNGVDGELFRNRSRKQALEELAEVDGGERLRESKVCATNLRQGYGGQAGASACGGESQKSKVCLFVGNLVRVKGPDVLLRAWQLLRQRTDDRGPRDKHGAGRRTEDAVPRHSDTPILVVIGEGRMRRKLQKQARRLGIADSVMFLGGRPHDEIALWMNVADCLCLTSRSEGMPNVVVEALASGLPVVATDVGACNDLLKDEPYAQVVPAGDVEAFASAASKVLAIDADRECMAQRHMDTFSWDKQARRILELMSQEQP